MTHGTELSRASQRPRLIDASEIGLDSASMARVNLSKDAKFGSNLKARTRLAAADQALFDRRHKPVRAAVRAFERQRKAIVTKQAVAAAAGLLRQHRQAYNQTLAKAHGNKEAIAKAAARLRAEADRALRASVPKFADYEALRDRFLQERSDLVDAHVRQPLTGLTFEHGVTTRPGVVLLDEFTAPFALFDVSPPAFPPNNRSFVVPKVGMVGTNINFRLTHSDSLLPFAEFQPGIGGDFRTAVGVNFRVPKTGFLTGSAVMRNLAAEFVMSATDNYGFSDATIDVVHSIFVTIVRSGEVQRFETNVYSDGLRSFGSDLNFSVSPILDASPFTVSFTGRDAFLKGEQIQILVGQAVEFGMHADDMSTFLSALTVWQVKKLSVGMLP